MLWCIHNWLVCENDSTARAIIIKCALLNMLKDIYNEYNDKKMLFFIDKITCSLKLKIRWLLVIFAQGSVSIFAQEG